MQPLILLALSLAVAQSAQGGPLKVFVLAGQSNMEGQGAIASKPDRNGGKGSLEYLVKDPATAPRSSRLPGRGITGTAMPRPTI